MSKSCQQQIDSVLGKEHRVGTRQIIIEAHDPHMWFVEAINNTQWPQPEALHASNNGWTTDINQRIYFRLKREAMQWFNMHDHLLPQSEAEEQQHAKNLCKTPIINDEPLPIKSSNLGWRIFVGIFTGLAQVLVFIFITVLGAFFALIFSGGKSRRRRF